MPLRIAAVNSLHPVSPGTTGRLIAPVTARQPWNTRLPQTQAIRRAGGFVLFTPEGAEPNLSAADLQAIVEEPQPPLQGIPTLVQNEILHPGLTRYRLEDRRDAVGAVP